MNSYLQAGGLPETLKSGVIHKERLIELSLLIS
jgi:hypothetical protein